ncbi:MAG: flagellar basal body protein [Burkholderiaceae bacterium]
MSLSITGLSGMRAAQLQLDTSAHNVANSQTPEFQRRAVTQTPAPGGAGVITQVVPDGPVASSDGSGFRHLAQDLVAQRTAVYNFAANLKSVQAEDEILGTLLDTRT